jgi:hypothetical protein
MAGPTGDQRRLIAETEDHIGALDELLAVYELALENEMRARRPNRRLIATLASRIEYTAAHLLAAKRRRAALTVELHVKDRAL